VAKATSRKLKPDVKTLGKFEPKRNRAVEDKVLEVISQGWSVTRAAQAGGVHRTTVFHWRDDAKIQRDALDPKSPNYRDLYTDNFCTRFEHAMESGVDVLEDEATRRATGYDEPVFGKDGQVGTRTLYSDPLMQMIMKGKRPDRYGIDRKEISGPNGAPIPHSVEIEFVSPASGKAKK
jgi:transposase-like protein